MQYAKHFYENKYKQKAISSDVAYEDEQNEDGEWW